MDNKLTMETPILDIVLVKPEEPKNDKLLIGYVINIINGKMAMQAELNNVTFLN